MKAKKKIASHFQYNENKIDIIRSDTKSGNEPPIVYYDNKVTSIDLSLSHDGRYVAYAFGGV